MATNGHTNGNGSKKKDPVLVVVQLSGGNDFMNTVIPFTNGHYYDARPLVHVPTPIASRGLWALEAALQSKAPAVWDEAELLEVSMLTPRGTADAGELGVAPRAMAAVLGAD